MAARADDEAPDPSRRTGSPIRRLARTGGIYLAGGVIQKLASLALLPLYTRYLTRAEFGAVEVLIQSVIGAGFLLRFGIVEALLRFYHRAEDEGQERWTIINVAFSFLFVVSLLGSLALGLAAGPASRFLLGHVDVTLLWISAFGLWVQCLVELTMAIVRLQERAILFLTLSIFNLVASVVATLVLLLGLKLGAAALLAGNFTGNAVMVVAILIIYRADLRPRVRWEPLWAMLHFGVPTMPAEVSVFLLTVVDRIAIVRIVGLAEAGIYSLGMKISQVSLFLVQGYYQAWPPFAYSIRDEEEAARIVGFVTSFVFSVLTWVALALGLLTPWIIPIVAGTRYAASAPVVPLVCFAAALYCVYLSLTVVLGRLSLTHLNFPLTVVGTIINIGLNLLLIPAYGAAGAAAALAGGYLAMLPGIWFVVRRRFPLRIDLPRLVGLVALGGGAFALGAQTAEVGLAPFLWRMAIALAFGLTVGFASLRGLRGLRAATQNGVGDRSWNGE